MSVSSRREKGGKTYPAFSNFRLITVLENLEIIHECAHLESSPVALLDVGKVEQYILWDIGR